MNKYVLGIDLGTSAVKAAIFDASGCLRAQGTAEYGIQHLGGSFVEQNPEEWWHATQQAVREAISDAGCASSEIRGVAVSSQAPTLLPIGSDGEVLRPAIIWMDQRAQDECEWLERNIGKDEVLRISGNSIDSYYTLPELMWFRRNEPRLFEQTSVILQANGYINYKLSDTKTIDRAHAGLTMMYDRSLGDWSGFLLEACGLNAAILPEIREQYEIVGEVTSQAARATGLSAGTPVVAGTVDGSAAALEAGVVDPGTVCDMTGTSTVLLAVVGDGVAHERLTWLPHVVPKSSLLIGTMSSTGGSLKWFKDNFGHTERSAAELIRKDSYELMNMEVEALPESPTGLIFLPYLSGERSPIWNPNARGVLFGIEARTSRAQVIRAVMEGTAYGIRHNLDVLADAGVGASEIRAVGGGSKSAVWNQIKADITGVPVVVPTTSIGAPLGDAIVAAVGVGLISGVREAIGEWFKPGRVYEPRPDLTSHYDNLYHIYRRIYEHLKEDFDALQAAL